MLAAGLVRHGLIGSFRGPIVGMQFPVVTVTVPVRSTVPVGAVGGVGAVGAPVGAVGAGAITVPGSGWGLDGAGAVRARAVVAVSVAAFEYRPARVQACTATR